MEKPTKNTPALGSWETVTRPAPLLIGWDLVNDVFRKFFDPTAKRNFDVHLNRSEVVSWLLPYQLFSST